MKFGALGFSTGLMYPPGVYSDTNEVVALAKVAAEFGGIYNSHVRNPVHGASTTSVVSDNDAASGKAQGVGQGASQPLEVTKQEQRMMERFRKMYGDRERRNRKNSTPRQ